SSEGGAWSTPLDFVVADGQSLPTAAQSLINQTDAHAVTETTEAVESNATGELQLADSAGLIAKADRTFELEAKARLHSATARPEASVVADATDNERDTASVAELAVLPIQPRPVGEA